MLDILGAGIVGGAFGLAIKRMSPKLCRVREDGRLFKWPWPELLGLCAFAVSTAVIGVSKESIPWQVFTALLVAVSVTDFWSKLIPDSLSLGGTVLGLILSTLFPAPISNFLHHGFLLESLGIGEGALSGLTLSALGAVAGFLLLEGIRRVFSKLAGMEVMGMGDSKLMLMMGAFLGPEVIVISFFPASLFGVVLGGIHSKIARTPHFPFGPSLALAGFGMAFFGDSLMKGIDLLMGSLRSMSPKKIILFNSVLLIIALWMILRIRKKASEYERIIDEDYNSLE